METVCPFMTTKSLCLTVISNCALNCLKMEYIINRSMLGMASSIFVCLSTSVDLQLKWVCN